MDYQPNLPANLHLVADASVGPRFRHDCSCCHFVGRQSTPQGDVDLYVHSANAYSATVIARYSSDGPDYSSGLVFAYGRIPLLTEARKRGQVLGLLEYNVYEALHYAAPETPEFDELKKALPFTVEYQMVLAFERGDVERSNSLATYLVDSQLARMRKYKPERSRSEAFHEVESQVVKVLMTYREYSWEQAYLHSNPILDDESERMRAEFMLKTYDKSFLDEVIA